PPRAGRPRPAALRRGAAPAHGRRAVLTARSESTAQTEALAAELAQRLEPGDIVLVRGEMGAGKTAFVRGACRALGVQGPVTSPTFTIGQRYAGPRGPIAHLDLHRLDGLEDEDPALLA